MDAARKPDPSARQSVVTDLIRATVDDESVSPTTGLNIDCELDAVQISAIVAAQAGHIALSPTQCSAAEAGGVVQFDALAFVPDRRTADRLALAISDWAARQGPAVIEFLYEANARYGQLATPEAQTNAVESLQACQRNLKLAEPPSRKRYRAWFVRQPPEMEWALPAAIETACGNWSRARAAAAGQPLVPIGAVRSRWPAWQLRVGRCIAGAAAAVAGKRARRATTIQALPCMGAQDPRGLGGLDSGCPRHFQSHVHEALR